ncbi:hypothetical protein T12_4570 [Trichinella patagoniensis]|uniref:Uncharacterized protein n=1 Tax=Trichinella patagoniensis TaxID=990121 RepID=A0A0V0Z5L7_9BILA|nr:hypothetical protein T12_4570 [Trichinella patagoniensis]
MVHGSWKQRPANFLFSQRVSPCATTGKSPAELLMKRRLRTVVDRIHPDIEEKTIESHSDVTKLDKQKIRMFAPDDLVFARNYAHGPKWCPATIVAPTGPVSYKVRTIDGQLWKRHLDQLRKRHPSMEITEDIETDVNKTQQSNTADNPSQSEQEDCQQLTEKSPSAVVEPIAKHISEPITETIAEQPTRPPRTRRKPKKSAMDGQILGSLIRSIKNSLHKVLQKALVDEEGFSTIRCDIEARTNARPLTYLSEDPKDPEVLTPYHFLPGTKFMDLPEVNPEDEEWVPKLQLLHSSEKSVVIIND